MQIVTSPTELRQRMSELQPRTIGIVPTMGALHAGHAELIETGRAGCQVLVVSIFVNPIQFNDRSDLEKYPRTWDEDLALCEKLGVDFVYAPSVEAMYPEGFQTTINVGSISHGLCGAARPGHFNGMATVVLKLLNASQASYAWFGEKDFQQFRIVQQMARDLDMGVEVIPVATVREADDLALSSRNMRLNVEQRKKAVILNQTMKAMIKAAKNGEHEVSKLLELGYGELAREKEVTLDYLEIVDSNNLKPLAILSNNARVLIAAQVGPVRLIDNMNISVG